MRSEVASLIWRLFGLPAPGAAARFDDVLTKSGRADTVVRLFERGITTGTTSTAFLSLSITARNQVITCLRGLIEGRDGRWDDASERRQSCTPILVGQLTSSRCECF